MAGKLIQFSCPACGAPVEIRAAGQSLAVACGNCGTIMDASSPAHQILSKSQRHQRRRPSIPVGAIGTFEGKKWQVVGFVVRMDKTHAYKWTEYLLHNPAQGYRWLVENQGHWNFVTMIKSRPEMGGRGLVLDGRSFRLYLIDRAIVDYVEGEFYWRIEKGESVATMDYIAPPFMLSCEQSDNEEVWSVGEYKTETQIQQAFVGVRLDLAYPSGVAPNEVNPHSADLMGLIFSFVGFGALGLMLIAGSSGANAFSALLCLGIYPGFKMLASSQFEHQRWENSDFPLGGGDGDDDEVL